MLSSGRISSGGRRSLGRAFFGFGRSALGWWGGGAGGFGLVGRGGLGAACGGL